MKKASKVPNVGAGKTTTGVINKYGPKFKGINKSKQQVAKVKKGKGKL